MILGIPGLLATDTVPLLILILALSDESKAVQKQAVASLGEIGPPAQNALPALTALTEKPLVGRVAKKAIASIAGGD